MARALAVRAATLVGVLFAVLVLLVVVLGATGFSDRILEAVVDEQIRGMRTGLSQTVRDPDELERILNAQRGELAAFYDLDSPWYFRLPDTVFRVLTLDLGEARTLRSFDGSRRVSDIVLERIPNSMLLLTTSMAVTAVIGLAAGVKMATRAGSRTDRVVSFASAVSFALPAWWTGILLILVLSFQFNVFPSGGMYSTPPPEGGLPRFFDLMKHALLPILTLVLVSVGPYLYSVRTMTLNVAQEDHVMVAPGQGNPGGDGHASAHPPSGGPAHCDGAHIQLHWLPGGLHPGGDRLQLARHGAPHLRRLRRDARRVGHRGDNLHLHPAVRGRTVHPGAPLPAPRPPGEVRMTGGVGEAIRVLLRSGPGKAGMVLLLALIAISLYVVATYPLDFGTKKWSTPAAWADNPKAVPPAWVNLLPGTSRVPHRSLTASMPSQATGGEHLYRLPLPI